MQYPSDIYEDRHWACAVCRGRISKGNRIRHSKHCEIHPDADILFSVDPFPETETEPDPEPEPDRQLDLFGGENG